MKPNKTLTCDTRFLSIAAITLTVALATGCNTTTQGNEGNIAFTPLDCGRLSGCDFADQLGAGGAIALHISGIAGFSTVGIELASTDLEVLAVTPTGDIGGQPTWALVGVTPGTASLLAIDSNGETVDYIDVSVVQPTRLIMENILGEAVGPVYDQPDFDEHWFVNANQRTVFHVTPVAADDTPVMGRYEYGAFVGLGLDEVVNDPNLLSLGQLDITPLTPGQYEASFADNYGNTIAVLIDVQNTP